jgi:hypothetical protein
LKVLRTRIHRAAFLDDYDLDVSAQAAGFAKKMDSKERASRPTAHDGYAIAVLEATE